MIRRKREKPPPQGFEILQDKQEEFTHMMREAEAEEEQYKTRAQVLWPILQIHHQRSRYIYDMYYNKKAISREVYEYCLDKKIADASLIAKWKKVGYERLCCLRCIQQDTSFNTTCICRVPKKDLGDDRQEFECLNCGCPGCSSQNSINN